MNNLCQSDAAAASGLDSRSFQHLVNHDLLKSIEEYVRRIGRMERLDQGMTTVYNQFSLAFTNIAVDECTNVGLDAHGEKLGRVDMNRAADNTRNDGAGMDNTIRAHSELYNTTGTLSRAENTIRVQSGVDNTTRAQPGGYHGRRGRNQKTGKRKERRINLILSSSTARWIRGTQRTRACRLLITAIILCNALVLE